MRVSIKEIIITKFNESEQERTDLNIMEKNIHYGKFDLSTFLLIISIKFKGKIQ